MSPRWGLGNWFTCVLYTYRPSGALEDGQVALDPDLSGMPDLRRWYVLMHIGLVQLNDERLSFNVSTPMRGKMLRYDGCRLYHMPIRPMNRATTTR